MIKLLLITVTCLLANTSFAEESAATPPTGSGFEEHKTTAIKNVDERIESLNKMKACISASTKHEDVKNCHKVHKEAMSAMHMEMKNDRLEKMNSRHEKLEKKIKELEAKKAGAEKTEH